MVNAMADVIEARVPDLGSDAGVPVIELLVKVGDRVQKDQGLLTLESDKATMEVPSPAAGEIIEILSKLGDELKNGDLVARIKVSAEPVGAIHESPVQSPSKPVSESVGANNHSPVQSLPAVAVPPKSPTHAIESSDLVPGNSPYASPAVRVFARELGVDLGRTWSCYKGGARHCGRCGTCVERREAFAEAGLPDPTVYENLSPLPPKPAAF